MAREHSTAGAERESEGGPALTFEVTDRKGRLAWRYGWYAPGPRLVAPPRDAEGVPVAPPGYVDAAAEAVNAAMTRTVAGFARAQDALGDLEYFAKAMAPVLALAVREELPGARRGAAELRTWIARRRHHPGTPGDLRGVLGAVDGELARALAARRRPERARVRESGGPGSGGGVEEAVGGTPETVAKIEHTAVTALWRSGAIRDRALLAAAAEIGTLMRYLPLKGMPRVRPLEDRAGGGRGGGTGGFGPGGYSNLPGDLEQALRARYRPWLAAASATVVHVDPAGKGWSEFDVARLAMLDGEGVRSIDAAMRARRNTAREALVRTLERYAGRE